MTFWVKYVKEAEEAKALQYQEEQQYLVTDLVNCRPIGFNLLLYIGVFLGETQLNNMIALLLLPSPQSGRPAVTKMTNA